MLVLISIFVPVTAHLLDVTALSEVFAAANRVAGVAAYRLQVISDARAPLVTASGLRLMPDRQTLDPDEPADTLFVTGPLDVPRTSDGELQVWLRRQADAARRFGAVRTGAFLLAATGLLDGRQVTTHWRYADLLAAQFPAAIIRPGRIFVRDGRLFTAAGAAAGMDLALALVEDDLGAATAVRVARQLVLDRRRDGGQSQLEVGLASRLATRPSIQEVVTWIRAHPSTDLSIAELRRRAAMSARNFARVFRQETGMTPAEFVESSRVDAARRLLRETRLPLKTIAVECGFGGVDGLRRAFLRRQGITPLAYRTRWLGGLSAAEQ